MCFHIFFKTITVTEKNATFVVFSPSLHVFFPKKEREKMEEKKEKYGKIAFDEPKKVMLEGKKIE